MVILGAGGHAKEVLDVYLQLNPAGEIAFFDNITPVNDYPILFKNYTRLKTSEELRFWFLNNDDEFLIGVGGWESRNILREMGIASFGIERTLVAPSAQISDLSTEIGDGTQIMNLVFISADVKIGKSVLLNTRANIHHDVTIEDYCEIGPSATVLGKVKIGISSFVGAGAIILPKVRIGDNCTIGAGAVVTKNIHDNATVKGNPAR